MLNISLFRQFLRCRQPCKREDEDGDEEEVEGVEEEDDEEKEEETNVSWVKELGKKRYARETEAMSC